MISGSRTVRPVPQASCKQSLVLGVSPPGLSIIVLTSVCVSTLFVALSLFVCAFFMVRWIQVGFPWLLGWLNEVGFPRLVE